MPKRGENIYKRKDGRWEGRYIKGRNGDRIIYGYVYAKSYSDAKQRLNQKRAEYIVESAKPSQQETKDVQFATVADQWLKSTRPSIKESTWVKYCNVLRCQIIPIIGERSISTIDYEVVSNMCCELLATGGPEHKGLACKTVADALSITRSIIKYAARMKYLTDHTALDVSVKVKQTQLRVFSHIEEQLIFTTIQQKQSNTNLGILICMFTGIRIGELCALRWEDISLESNCIRVHRTMQRLQTAGGPRKTQLLTVEPKSQCSVRDIPIAATLRGFLEKSPTKEGYILTGSGSSFVEPRTMQNRFKAILKDCGISNASFHTLRHTFATRCIEVGFDIKSLSEILGHANVSITLNRYVHPSMEQKQKNIDKLSDFFAVNKTVL